MKNIKFVQDIQKMAMEKINFQWVQLKSTEEKVNYEFYYRLRLIVDSHVDMIKSFNKMANWSQKLDNECKKSIAIIEDKLKDFALQEFDKSNPYQ